MLNIFQVESDGTLLGFIETNLEIEKIEEIIEEHNGREDKSFDIRVLVNTIRAEGHRARLHEVETIEI
jgi:hypothetical protein